MARILVVDDDPVFNSFLEKALSKLGHHVVSVGDGLEALGKIYAGKFDLAVIDAILPYVSGIKLLETIKKHRPITMVVMVSGQADLEIAIDSLHHGAYDFIKKPVRMEELQDVVQNALRESHLMRSSGYVYKDSRGKAGESLKRGILYAASDSIMVSLAFLIAFLAQSIFIDRFNQPPLIGDFELVRVSLGLAFCFAFISVFRRSFRFGLVGNGRELIGNIWSNLTQSYIVFLAILFLGSDIYFMANRIGIGMGYVLGFGLLLTNRFLLIPNLLSIIGREGKKNIVILGSGKAAGTATRQIPHELAFERKVGSFDFDFASKKGPASNARLITSVDDVDRILIKDDVEELYITRDVLTSSEILNMLDQFKNRRLKIVVLDSR